MSDDDHLFHHIKEIYYENDLRSEPPFHYRDEFLGKSLEDLVRRGKNVGFTRQELLIEAYRIGNYTKYHPGFSKQRKTMLAAFIYSFYNEEKSTNKN